MNTSLLNTFKENAILSEGTLNKIVGGGPQLEPIYRIDGEFVYGM